MRLAGLAQDGLQEDKMQCTVFLHARQRAVTDASRKFSLHLACEGCRVIPSGWQSSWSEKLKRAKGLERNLSSLSLLNSSAQTFFLPETWETSRATECACDQEATRRRKRLSGQAVEKSLLTPASVRVLSEPAGMAKERYL